MCKFTQYAFKSCIQIIHKNIEKNWPWKVPCHSLLDISTERSPSLLGTTGCLWNKSNCLLVREGEKAWDTINHDRFSTWWVFECNCQKRAELFYYLWLWRPLAHWLIVSRISYSHQVVSQDFQKWPFTTVWIIGRLSGYESWYILHTWLFKGSIHRPHLEKAAALAFCGIKYCSE